MPVEKRPIVLLAQSDDRERAWEIVEEYNDAVGVVERDDRKSFAAYLQRPRAFWLAESEGRVAGCVALRPLSGLDGRSCEVKRLYVRPEHRGLGVAAALMDAVERYATEEGYRFVYLDTFEGLAAAVRFYTARGYERVARYNDNPQATIFMRLRLQAIKGEGPGLTTEPLG
jgi:GNAT superfamily N-acetyltransferase